jgi:hypothetical protein
VRGDGYKNSTLLAQLRNGVDKGSLVKTKSSYKLAPQPSAGGAIVAQTKSKPVAGATTKENKPAVQECLFNVRTVMDEISGFAHDQRLCALPVQEDERAVRAQP